MKPQGQIGIRPAGSDDFDDVAGVWHESASHMDGATSPIPSLIDFRERINRELEAGWELYIAERNNRVIGMLALKPQDRVLDQIFVLPSEQSTGVGMRLLDEAKRAMPEGFTLRMALANQRAGRFYEHAGLDVIRDGVHPNSGVPVRYLGWHCQ